MRVTWPVLLIAIVCLGGCGRQLPPDQARSLLRNVQTARQTLAVEGKLSTAISVRGQMLKAEAETQRGAGAIHLKYLTGRFAGWQIIEQDGMVWRVDPQGKPGPSPIAPEAGLGLPLEANLQVRYTWPVHVAGRRAYRYVIQPPGRSRARLILAVDAETSYPLRLERYNSAGSLMSESVFREINYNAAAPARVKPPEVAQRPGDRTARRARQATERELEQLLGGPLLKPTYLPPGFRLRGYYAHQTRRGQAAEIRYADGLRTLSVVQFTRPTRQPGLLPGRPQLPGGGQGGQRWQGRRERAAQWRERRGQAPDGAPQPPGAGPGRWWQRFRQGQPQGPGQGQGWGRPQRGPLGRSSIREPRGTRMVIVAGDAPPEELGKVLQSVPYPPGRQPTTTL